MRDDGGGGGGTILIDPTSLRRCATVLNEVASDLTSTASCLRGTGLPTMPSPIAGQITSGIQDVAGVLSGFGALHDAAAELKARATWADVANALGSGYPLSGSLLREFVRGLEDGSVMRYATPEDKQRAGAWVGGAYRHTFDEDPSKLVELSKILRGSGYDPDFAESFVRSFGGDNLVRVPRVIQAMQWPTALQSSTSPFADRKLALDLQYGGYELKDDPESLLSGFAMTLAVATSAADTSRRSSRLRDEEDDIAQSDDHWAVTQLLQNGPPAGRRFLGEVFRHQVIPLVRQDTTDYMLGGMPTSEYPIGDLQGDPKEVLLRALARNPAAAGDALSTPLPDKVFFQTPYGPVESNDPVEILYRGHWHDGGQTFADVYTTAVDHLQGTGDAAGTSAAGNAITRSLLTQVLQSPSDHLDPAVEALSNDLAQHHLTGLFEGLQTSESSIPAGDGRAGVIMSDGRLYVSAHDLQETLKVFADNGDVDRQFLDQVAKHEAHQLVVDLRHEPDSAYRAGYGVGSFNQIVLNAHDLQNGEDYASASEKQRLAFGFVKEVVGLATEEHPLIHAGANQLLDYAEGQTAPDAGAVSEQNFEQKLDTVGDVKLLLTTAAHEAGHVHDAPPPSIVDPHTGALKPYGSLDPAAKIDYQRWGIEATDHSDVLKNAFQGASDGMSDHEQGDTVHG